MSSGIDTEGQATDNGQTGRRQRASKGAGIDLALPRRIAAADDCQRRPIEQLRAAFDIEQNRWIRAVEQGLRIRGVSEGDATRYALSRREPLLVELEAFMDFIAGDDDAHVVSLAEGLEAAVYADAVLEAASSGETVRPVAETAAG